MDLAIRSATADDDDVIADIYRQASLSNEGDRERLLAQPELLKFDPSWTKDSRVRVATVAGQVVGLATTRRIEETVVELDDLFVDPGWTCRGVARALMADAVTAARAEGASRIEVSANLHAEAFYVAVGFVAVRTVETPLGPSPRMHLALECAQAPRSPTRPVEATTDE